MNNSVDFLLDRFRAASGKTAFVEVDGTMVQYGDLLRRIDDAGRALEARRIGPGHAVQLVGDFGAAATAWLLAAWRLGAVVGPLAPSSLERKEGYAGILGAEAVIDVLAGRIVDGPGGSPHPLYEALRASDSPGLVIFTSGTTGTPKGALHDVRRLLTKFHAPGKDLTTLAFLLFDHTAGMDTLLYCIANASTVVCLPDRSVETVCKRIAKYDVEVLPTAPSFLNLLLLERQNDFDSLRSLKIVTYGGETMPQGVLDRLADSLPNVRLIQKYGTSELGALRSRSENDRSQWLDLGGKGTRWRVSDGLLEVNTETAMLGYLNAPSPFTPDGWYKTGDRVEVEGESIRILGRDSDLINVGGQKVYPAEVEEAIGQLPGVADVAVFGLPHPILGATVCARVKMAAPGTSDPEARTLIRKGLVGRLEGYKIPQKIEVTAEPLSTDRSKRRRTIV